MIVRKRRKVEKEKEKVKEEGESEGRTGKEPRRTRRYRNNKIL